MRTISVGFGIFLLAAVGFAQAPAKAPAAKAAAPKAAPATKAAPLSVLMRGVLFPSANLLFDVQQNDPGVPKKAASGGTGGSTTETFANVYSGWQVVEGAAAALDEVVDSILKPRLCENGKPAPVANADYRKAALNLRKVAKDAQVAAFAKNRDKLNDIANDLSDACANCHEIYRDGGAADSPLRCVAAKKKS